MDFGSGSILTMMEMATLKLVQCILFHKEIQMSGYFDVPKGFEWIQTPDASVIFALNTLIGDERFSDFELLLSPRNNIPGVSVIEWCDIDCSPNEDCPYDWPEGAAFCAYVDPDMLNLKYPRMFLTRKEFYGYLRKGIRSFMAQNPMKAAKAQPVLDLMDATEDISAGSKQL
jgi:hypothetical protein